MLELLVPARCLACRARAPLPWCRACAALAVPLAPGCPRCSGVGLGHACWTPDAPIDATIAAYDYRGVVAASIVTAKVGGARAGWPGLAAELARRVVRAAPPADVVTWVTTPAVRSRRRGGDHARTIAAAVAVATGLPLAGLLEARPRRGGGDAYRPRHALPATDVLLVDDVVTTGATALAAAAALVRGGAGRVTLAVLARAGSHALGPPPTVDRPADARPTSPTMRSTPSRRARGGGRRA